MAEKAPFHLQDFMPYLLNQAAEATSADFQKYYKASYGMLRTEWRVLFHLGRYGDLTAKTICTRAKIHKTKVSRAVVGLENRRFLTRKEMEKDRRQEMLSLTTQGRAAFKDLVSEAERYNENLMSEFSTEECATVRHFLLQVAQIE